MGVRNRQLRFGVLILTPYNRRLLNAINLGVWLMVIGVMLLGIYLLFIPHEWLAGPWTRQNILLDIYAFNPFQQSVTLWRRDVIIAGSFLPFLGVMWLRSKHVGLADRFAPYAYLCWLGVMMVYSPLSGPEQVKFTSAGIAYRWGFVGYSQVRSYQWHHSTSAPNAKLTLYLRRGLLQPVLLTWTINGYEEASVNRVLMQHLAGTRSGANVPQLSRG